MTIVLNIGHGIAIGRQGMVHDPGATNQRLGLTEWQLCEQMVADLVRLLQPHVSETLVSIPRQAPIKGFADNYFRIAGDNIASGLRIVVTADHWDALPRVINGHNPTACIAFHINSFADPTAKGSQVNYWHTSTKGRALAARAMVANSALGLTKRVDGTGLLPQSGGRGVKLLAETNCPCIINEPFFISNPSEVETYRARYADYVAAWRDVILSIQKTPL